MLRLGSAGWWGKPVGVAIGEACRGAFLLGSGGVWCLCSGEYPLWLVTRENPAPSGACKVSVLQLCRIPVWTLRAGLGFLGCWLVLCLLGSLRMLSNVTDLALQFGPVLLGLGVAFTAYGMVYHVAINMAHWREVREGDHEGQMVLSGRKRFERRKELPAGPGGGRDERGEEEAGVFDALD